MPNTFFGLTGAAGLLGLLLSVIIICVSAIVIVIIILKALGRYKNINLFSNRFKLSKEDKDSAKESFACYNSKCHPQKLGFIILKTVETYANMKYEKDMIYEEQKMYLEQKIDCLKEIDIKSYIDLVKDLIKLEGRESVVRSDTYQLYRNLVYRVYQNAKVLFKTFLKENHLGEFLQVDKWENYKQEKIDLLLARMNAEFDLSFTPTLMPITLNQINEWTAKMLRGEIRDCFNDIFDRSKDIFSERNKKIEEIQKEYDEFIESLTGEKATGRIRI